MDLVLKSSQFGDERRATCVLWKGRRVIKNVQGEYIDLGSYQSEMLLHQRRLGSRASSRSETSCPTSIRPTKEGRLTTSGGVSRKSKAAR